MADRFTHLDEQGRSRMVDTSGKPPTARMARARAFLRMGPGTVAAFRTDALPKGNPFEAARLAGILAAKKTAELIPLCHPLPLDHVDVRLALTEAGVEIEAEARCTGPTGVEMEALTAAAVAGLTLYDMAKAVDKGMVLEAVRLVEKTGGKSGEWKAE